MELSDEQRLALWGKSRKPLGGRQFLSARPGTGKTHTVTSYCLDLVTDWTSRHEPWQGMAVLSYTNVAKDEVEQRVRSAGAAHALLRNPHFVGTLDAFINQQVFLPHGAKHMDYDGDRPTLVGEPYHQWRAPWTLHNSAPAGAYKPLWFDCYTLGRDDQPMLIDGTPRMIARNRARTPWSVSAGNTSKILSMKRYVWNHGMALQADANYLAYGILQAAPMLARALAHRYPVLVVDEAQDMTEIQQSIIDTLIAAGLRHVVLVGDENQAIYEWNTARPDLFTAHGAAEGWRRSVLRESYRCSPAICHLLSRMADDGVILVAAEGGKNRDYKSSVDVCQYTKANESSAVRQAIDLVAEALDGTAPHGGNDAGTKTLAVISRSSDDARRLHSLYSGNPIDGTERTVWESALTRDFLKVVHYLRGGEPVRAARAYEQLLIRAGDHASVADMRAAVMREHSISAADNVEYRVLLFKDVRLIADASAPMGAPRISDCATVCDLPLVALGGRWRNEIKRDCASFSDKAKAAQDRLLPTLFAARGERTWQTHPEYPSVRILFATVHAVKGETHDAVIFHTKHRVHACGCPESKATWRAVLGHKISSCETKRIGYVACSRPAQALLILAEGASATAWQALAT